MKVGRLVYFSTIHTLQQKPFDSALDESRPNIASAKYPPYDRSKAAAEKIMRQAISDGLNGVIVNPTGIIGPYDYEPSFLGQALILIAKDRFPALVKGGFNWVDVRDVVTGAMNAGKLAPPGASYLLSGHYVSLKSIADMVGEITGVRIPGFICPMLPAKMYAPIITSLSRFTGKRPIFTIASLRALENCNHQISHVKATNELSYHPRPIRETISDTLQWFKANGFL